MTKIRVLLADDHAILREGLKALLGLADDIDVVGEAADGQEAIDRVAALGARRRRHGRVDARTRRPRGDARDPQAASGHAGFSC